MNITKAINIGKKFKNKQLMVNYKQYNLDHWTHSMWMLLLTSLNYYSYCQTRIH